MPDPTFILLYCSRFVCGNVGGPAGRGQFAPFLYMRFGEFTTSYGSPFILVKNIITGLGP